MLYGAAVWFVSEPHYSRRLMFRTCRLSGRQRSVNIWIRTYWEYPTACARP